MRRPVIFFAAIAAVSALAACDGRVAGGKADGAAIFGEVCARCHGGRGVPDPSMVAQLGVKDLTQPHVQRELSDADLVRQIRQGSPNRRMPSFEGALDAAQIDAVVRYVRSLGAVAP